MESLSYENATPMDVGPPPLRGEVCILGRKYSLPKEKAELAMDVKSRLWFTYRKNFKAISGTSITCDQGWGCTLRCGQMVMGNTLLFKHLGRDWRWQANGRRDDTYMRILKMFLDKKDSEYSLHMIAHQGADFGRPIGQWFGPNNIAQALKKLATHESWTQLAVHVALDMVVVIEDMKALCREPHHTLRNVRVELEEWADKRRAQTAPDISLPNTHHQKDGMMEGRQLGQSSDDLLRQRRYNVAQELTVCLRAGPPPNNLQREEHEGEEMKDDGKGEGGEYEGKKKKKKKKKVVKNVQHQAVADGVTRKGLTNGKECKEDKLMEDDKREGEEAVTQKGLTNGTEHKTRQRFPKLTKRSGKRKKESLIKSADFDRVAHRDYADYTSSSSSDSGDDNCLTNEVGGAKGSEFRSLLLFIPLRLGQEKFNMEYKEAVKACLSLPQSVGIIGGRPRHALYFIGYHGDNMLYLDPHTTQSAVFCSDTTGMVPDQSYHCSQPDRMNISDLDPSVALAFFCKDESDIDDLCRRLKECVLSKMQYMFELTDKRPLYWGPLERNPLLSVHEPFLLVNQAPPSPEYKFEEDSDGFEIIDYA